MTTHPALRTTLAVSLLAALVYSSLAAQEKSTQAHYLDVKTPAGLKALLKFTGEPLPLVSGHRGGAGAGYPENCIATFERTLSRAYAMLEVDPRFTKDGHIVLH